MRELTFESFLSDYLKKLSYCGSNNINKLLTEYYEKNIRLKEVIDLYIIFSDKADLFKTKLLKFNKEYDNYVIENYTKQTILDAFINYKNQFKNLYNEIINDEVFDCIKEKLKSTYYYFIICFILI